MAGVPYEIRMALDMPDADLEQACERIRTLRQTEMAATVLLAFRKGTLMKGKSLELHTNHTPKAPFEYGDRLHIIPLRHFQKQEEAEPCAS